MMKAQRAPSPGAKTSRNREIACRSEAGESVADLARAYGLSRVRIQQILEEHDAVTWREGLSFTADVRPATLMKTLPISTRLTNACNLLMIVDVGGLSKSLSKLRQLDNIGVRTLLEATEIVNEAGLRCLQERTCSKSSSEYTECKPNKRHVLRSRGT